MDTIGIDLHQRESQVCILTEDGELVERRIATTRERLTSILGGRPRSRVVLEASTESEWVARHVEALGHEVIVADPGLAPMDASRRRRVKTDQRDARTLCEACKVGAYRAVHRASDAQRHVRASGHRSSRSSLRSTARSWRPTRGWRRLGGAIRSWRA